MPKSRLAEALAEGGEGIPPVVQAQAMQKLADESKAKRKKRAPSTRKVKKVFDARYATPPPGFRWVYNRLDRPYEEMFDGMVYRFDAQEYRLLTLEVAMFLFNASLIQVDLARGIGVRALAMSHAENAEKREYEYFGVPLVDPKNVELIDRTTDPNYTGKVAPGVGPTRPALISIADAGRGSAFPR